jgi:ribosomal protein S25
VRRCVAVREVAETLGIQYKSACNLLKRLEKRGLLVKKEVGRVAVYCGEPSLVESLLNKKRNRKVKGWERLTATRDLLRREGCVSTYALTKRLGLNSEEARYVAAQLVEEGEAVGVIIGRTAVWCRDRAAVEELMTRLKETVHKLAVGNKMKYVTPAKILRVVQNDREAYALFSRFIPLSRIDRYFSPVALAFADGVLRMLYGESVHTRRKAIYFVSQPRAVAEINIRDSIDKKTVSVSVPDDLAAALQGVDVEDLTLQAIEQLLTRYRT